MSQGYHVTPWAYLFAHMLCLIVLSCSSMGMPLCAPAMSKHCHVADKEYIFTTVDVSVLPQGHTGSLFIGLLCPSATTWCQLAHLFAPMSFPSRATWQCLHACLHTYHDAPALLCGSLDTPVCTADLSQYRHMVTWYSCSHRSCVTALQYGGVGMTLHMPAMFQCHHVAFWSWLLACMLCLATTTRQCGHFLLHACRVPMLLESQWWPGHVYLHICCVQIDMTALTHLFVCVLSPSTTCEPAWSLTSCVPASSFDARGLSVHMPAIFQQCHMVVWA